MMGEIMKEFWYGNVHPQEEIRKKAPYFQRAAKNNNDAWDAFAATLSAEQQKQLQTLLTDTDDLQEYYGYLSFSYGYRLAMDFAGIAPKDRELTFG